MDRLGDDAVSVVIAAVTLVAIVAMVSAGLMSLLREYGTDQDTGPSIAWMADDDRDAVRVVQAPPGLDWSELAITADADIRFRLNAPADGSAPAAPAGVATPLVPGALTAGDVVHLCAEGGAQEVRFSFTFPATLHQASTVMRFRLVDAC